MTPDLLTVADVARRLSVHEKTVRRLVARGELVTVRIGAAVRLLPDDVDTYIAEHRAAGRERQLSVPKLRREAPHAGFADRLRSLEQ